MSQIQVDNIYNKEATGGPNFPLGANVTGVVTATTFKGGAEITGGTITANTGSFTGNVSIGGTLTYEDVTNVDSVGVVTARDGIKTNVSPSIAITDGSTEKGYIGFNGNDPFIGRKNGVGLVFQNNKIRPADGDDGSPSTNTVDLGEPTYKFKDGYFAGNLYGNGSNLSGIEAAPTAQLVTSENLVAGDAVSVKTNGQIEKTTSNVTQINPLNGTSIWINGSQDGDETSVASDPENPTKLYAIYRHQNNQIYSKIATITGTSSYDDITWAHVSTNISPVTTNGHEAVSLCNIGGSAGTGKYLAVVGETTAYVRVINVNYGSNAAYPESGYATLNSGNDMRNWDVESFGTDRAVISYRSNYDSKVYVVGVSISGNTVTLGTPVEFDASTNLGDVNIRRMGDSSKFLTTWYKDTSDGLLCRMGNFDTSTNTVTIVGNELTIDSDTGTPVGAVNSLTYTKDNKWISTYRAVSQYLKGAVISYDSSGNTISKGTILQISGNQIAHQALVYDSDGDRTISMYEDRDSGGGGGALRAQALTVSGTTLSATSYTQINNEEDVFICKRSVVYSTYWGASFGLMEAGNSNDLYKLLLKSSTVTTNSGNFIGFVGGSFSASSTATVQVVGNINTNQSGLTAGSKYYLQKDGSLNIVESNPSVYAGRALSATSLLIKG